MYFDTHAHYNNNRFDDDRDELLSSMQADGITRILNVSYNLPSVRQALCMADKYPFAYATAGIHPHDTKTMADDTVLELESYLSHPKAVAVGEIGLDYHYDFSPRDVQRARFREQMELARRLKLPVVIHMRDATQDTLKIAHDFKDVICVYHCFPETYEIAKIVFDMGGYISFTGIVTFKNAQQARDVVKKMPLDRLMLETDCPYMSPEPFRGRRCTSLYLPYIAEKIAETRGTSVEKIAAVTMANAKRFFCVE